MKMVSALLTSSIIMILSYSSASFADLLTCGTDARMAGVDPAEDCEYGPGNPLGNGSTINDIYGPSWTDVGSETADGVFGQWFDVQLDDGSSWGSGSASGTWTIDEEFWNVYDDAVITLHVGGNPQDDIPDHWAWLITDGATEGIWEYDLLSGNGGGLSNLHLWGRGTAETVSEPGSIALIALGLAGVLTLRRKS